MRVSLSWLQDMVNIPVPINELAEKLSIAGFEVESLEDLSSLAEGVLVGFVISKQQHPNADKLSVCQVNIGAEEPLQIVCGAPNVRQGIHVPVATIGSTLPAKALRIKEGELRGIKSQGMICSLAEMGITTEEVGICVLDELQGVLPGVGEPVASFLGLDDTIIELAITANRPDGMSMVGIAKEVSAITQSELLIEELTQELVFKKFNSENYSDTDIRTEGIFGLTLIEEIDNIKNSSDSVLKRIKAVGLNSINKIVDITNYVMLEQGQPLHAYDADSLEILTHKKVNNESFGIRYARIGEDLTALDGSTISLNKESLVVTCHDMPIALAGVIGSKETAVNHKTKRIWIESAIFSASSVRNSSRSVGIRTEASSRYEKGIPTEITLLAAERAVNLLRQYLNCKIKGCWFYGNERTKNETIELRRMKVHNLLGPLRGRSNYTTTTLKPLRGDQLNQSVNLESDDISDKDITSSLKAIGCFSKPIDVGWSVTVPPSRKQDLTREVDLIEEIARLIGFDKFESNLPDPLEPGGLNPKQKAERQLRESFCNNGFQEITTFSLVNKSSNQSDIVPIKNPLLAETSHLRTNLSDEHLNICQRNLKSGQRGCWIFEIGKIYLQREKSIKEETILGGVICGERRLEKWKTSGKSLNLDYYEARGRLAQALMRMNIEILDLKCEIANTLLHPGKSSNLSVEGKKIGEFGQLHPNVSNKCDLPLETYIFSMRLSPLIDAATRTKKWTKSYKQYSTVPFLERDISIIVPKHCSSQRVSQIIMKAGKPFLEKVELIDRFEGGNLDIDKCSQAYRLWYRDKNRTLTEPEIKPVHQKIRKSLVEQLSAELRS